MERQKSSYANRKKHYEDLLKKQTISFISLLRLIIFVAGLGFSIFFYMRATYYLSVFVLIITLITFITLAIKHKKIKYNKIRCTILCEINENCLKRLDNNWKGFSDSGQDFVDETHSYSRDLDIFGDNSLFQWINTCITYLGRQKLKESLQKPKYNIEEIYKRQQAVKELAKNIGWTQRFETEAILSENKNHDPDELFKWAEDKNEFLDRKSVV